MSQKWEQSQTSDAIQALGHVVKQWLVATFQRLVNSPDFTTRVGLLVGLSATNVGIGALFYKLVSGCGFIEALFKVYATLFAVPGSDVTSESSFAATLSLNVIFLVGLLVFAVLLGMVGEEVASHIDTLRSGKGPLHLKGHIVLLNWNQQVVPVISELVGAQSDQTHPFHGRPIVVLAERDKDDMTAEISEVLKRYGGRSAAEIHTRTGSPYRVEDLNIVSASRAAYILLMYPDLAIDQSNAEALKAATVAALSTLDNFSNQSLVVQVPDEMSDRFRQMDVVQHLLKAEGTSIQIVRLSERAVVDRLIAQTALQPGVVSIYLEILRHGKAHNAQGERKERSKKDIDFRWIDLGDQYGICRYGDLRRRFHTSQVVGYVSIDEGVLRLNPEEDSEVKAGDKMLVLQKGRRALPTEIAPDAGFYTAAAERAAQRVGGMGKDIEPPAGVNVLVAGWPQEELAQLAAGFIGFAPPNSTITFLLSELPEEPPEDELFAHFRYLVCDDPLGADALVEGGVATADAVVVGCPPGLEYPDSDSLVLSTMFQVQQLVADSDRMVHIVAKASNNNTRKVAKKFFHQLARRNITFELLIPDSLTSAILTQVASQPFVFQLCHELMMTPDGNELYILEIEQLGFSIGERVQVAEIMEAGKLLQMSLLGYAKRGGTKQVLAPEPDEEVLLEAGDKFVVVADLVN